MRAPDHVHNVSIIDYIQRVLSHVHSRYAMPGIQVINVLMQFGCWVESIHKQVDMIVASDC